MKHPKKISSLVGLIGLVTSLNSSAQNRDYEQKTRVIRNLTNPLNIRITPDLVKCSAIGYPGQELKLSVPDLDMLTHFHHANYGEIYPCITAGPCKKGRMPEDLIRTDEPSIEAKFNVEFKEKYFINHTEKTCSRSLEEVVTTKIRGFDFTHYRDADIGDFPYELCTKL